MKNLFKVLGFIALIAVIGFSMAACADDDGGGGDRWFKWEDPTATAKVDYSVDPDGVCTITVGGTAESSNDRWKAVVGYSYTATAGKSYTYRFEAWTDSGTRTFGVQYYSDNDDNVHIQQPQSITNTRTTYTITGETLPKGGNRSVSFQCADKTGTFYVKILSIQEVGSSSGGPSFSGTWKGIGYDDHVAYTVVITGDTIKISNATGSITGTLEKVEKTLTSYRRDMKPQAGLVRGHVSIPIDNHSTLNLYLILGNGSEVADALGLKYDLSVYDMTKQVTVKRTASSPQDK